MCGSNSILVSRLKLFCAAFLLGVCSLYAKPDDLTLILSPDEAPLTKGATGHLNLNVLNRARHEISWTFPAAIKAQMFEPGRTNASLVELSFSGDSSEATLGVGAFAQGTYSFAVPLVNGDELILEPTVIKAGRVVLSLKAESHETPEELPRNRFF